MIADYKVQLSSLYGKFGQDRPATYGELLKLPYYDFRKPYLDSRRFIHASQSTIVWAVRQNSSAQYWFFEAEVLIGQIELTE